MTIVLRPMPNEAYAAFIDTASATYAADNVASGRWRAAEAPALARAETDKLLPQGPATPGHHLFEIVDGGAANGKAVGFIWFAEMARGSARLAFVYQVYVAPEHRRRGHARAALLALEDPVVGLGLGGLALHVFDFNEPAKALYRSLGFGVTSLNLFKPLAPRGS